jgi:hypothetical protein
MKQKLELSTLNVCGRCMEPLNFQHRFYYTKLLLLLSHEYQFAEVYGKMTDIESPWHSLLVVHSMALTQKNYFEGQESIYTFMHLQTADLQCTCFCASPRINLMLQMRLIK